MFQTACFVLCLQLIQTGIFDAFHYTGRLNVFVHEPTGCGQAGYFAAKEKGRLKCFQTAFNIKTLYLSTELNHDHDYRPAAYSGNPL
mgnify:CR=1 FL=1